MGLFLKVTESPAVREVREEHEEETMVENATCWFHCRLLVVFLIQCRTTVPREWCHPQWTGPSRIVSISIQEPPTCPQASKIQTTPQLSFSDDSRLIRWTVKANQVSGLRLAQSCSSQFAKAAEMREETEPRLACVAVGIYIYSSSQRCLWLKSPSCLHQSSAHRLTGMAGLSKGPVTDITTLQILGGPLSGELGMTVFLEDRASAS